MGDHGTVSSPEEREVNESYRTLAPGERPAPILDEIAGGADPQLVWRNVLGGQTWRIGDRYLKWSPDAAGIDLRREAERLRWLAGRHPAPRLLDAGRDGDGAWILTAAIDGESAIGDGGLADPRTAIRAIADGLRRVHALPVEDVPSHWTSWITRAPAALGGRPPIDDPVVVHGDACAPNTLIDAQGFVATVDVSDLAVGDRWADIAVAARSLDWNYGPGWQPFFLDAYGTEPDPARAAYYAALFDAES